MLFLMLFPLHQCLYLFCQAGKLLVTLMTQIKYPFQVNSLIPINPHPTPKMIAFFSTLQASQ